LKASKDLIAFVVAVTILFAELIYSKYVFELVRKKFKSQKQKKEEEKV